MKTFLIITIRYFQNLFQEVDTSLASYLIVPITFFYCLGCSPVRDNFSSSSCLYHNKAYWKTSIFIVHWSNVLNLFFHWNLNHAAEFRYLEATNKYRRVEWWHVVLHIDIECWRTHYVLANCIGNFYDHKNCPSPLNNSLHC